MAAVQELVNAGNNFQHPDVLAMAEQQARQAVATQEAMELEVQAARVPNTATTSTTEATPTADPVEPRRKYAGKYDSIEKFEEGYWNSAQEAMRLATELKVTKEILAANQRVNPTERVEARETYLDELRDAAIPVEALDRLIEDRVNRGVHDALAPIARGHEARNEMIEQFPNYEQVEKGLNKFLSANPDVNDDYTKLMTAGQERLAMKMALLEFERRNPAVKPIVDASGQEQAVARATGSLSGNTVGAREVSGSFENKLNAANQRFAVDNDARALAAVALMGLHPDMATP